ncbi:MAG: NAD(P)H-hydrate dehydratase [Candidatus Micrarchaeales archaeon]
MQKLKEFATFTQKILSLDQVRAIDMNVAALGISEIGLIDNAGRAVSDFVKKNVKPGERLLIVCGRGKNGADGFACAKHMSRDYKVTVALLGSEDAVTSPEVKFHLESILKNPAITFVDEAEKIISELLKECDMVVDAIFGTGFHDKLGIGVAKVVDLMNNSGKSIIAVDIPSGLSDQNKKGKMVHAKYTITFHKMKEPLVKNRNAGKVIVADVGIPIEAEIIVGPGDLYLASSPRGMYSSKSENGKAVIIGGSKNIHGAPSLSSNSAYSTLAALRIGIGYTITCVPRGIANVVRKVSPDIIVRETSSQNISTDDLQMLERTVKSADSIVIGPGLGREKESILAASSLISYSAKLGKRIIVDADAIYSIKGTQGRLNKSVLLTPNDKEFASISNAKIPQDNLKGRVRAAIRTAKVFNATILLKGHQTIITDGKIIKIVSPKSSTLATMGTGDVLSGIIAGYAARNKNILVAATAAAYLHAIIGDELGKEEGTHILASDIVERIPMAIKEFDKNVV